MDLFQALENAAKLAPVRAHWTYVPLVRAALSCNATYLRIRIDGNGTFFDFDGDAIAHVDNLFQVGLESPRGRPERHLTAGMYALNKTEPGSVSYESWDGTQGTRIKVASGKVTVRSYSRAPWKEDNLNHRVSMLPKKGWLPFFGGSSSSSKTLPPEIKVLKDICRFAPIPIEVNGEVISRPVDLGRSLVCIVFEPGPGVKRLKMGPQQTLAQVSLESGEAYSAIIAVGGKNPQLASLNLVVDGLLVKVTDPELVSRGLRCVITCNDLDLDEKGKIIQDEVYTRVVEALTSNSLAIGAMLAENLGQMSTLDRVEAGLYIKHYADRQEARGEIANAERMLVQLLEAQQGEIGVKDPDLAGTLLKIADLQCRQGKNEEAKKYYNRVLKLFADIRPDPIALARCHSGLATIDLAEGKLAEAETQAQQALEMRRSKLPADDLQIAANCELLARIYRALAQYPDRRLREVDGLYLEALRIVEKQQGESHPEVTRLLLELAAHRRQHRRYREAEPLINRALELRQQTLGEQDTQVADTLDILGGLYEEQGRSLPAGKAYSQALAIWEARLGPDHSDVLQRVQRLALLYRLYGKFARAEPLYKRIIRHSPKETAQDRSNLALLYAAQGKYPKAEEGLLRALELIAAQVTFGTSLDPESVGRNPGSAKQI